MAYSPSCKNGDNGVSPDIYIYVYIYMGMNQNPGILYSEPENG
jgi:hypothetical protein